MEQWMMWLGIAVLAFVFEAITSGLTTIWFGVSAVVTALLTAILDGYIGDKTWFFLLQIVFFVAMSAFLLVLTKPLAGKLMKTGATNTDSVIGKRAVVLEQIDNIEGKGQVKLNGNVWTARSLDDSVIESGAMVEVKEISGVSAIVKKID